MRVGRGSISLAESSGSGLGEARGAQDLRQARRVRGEVRSRNRYLPGGRLQSLDARLVVLGGRNVGRRTQYGRIGRRQCQRAVGGTTRHLKITGRVGRYRQARERL